jgi:hypothetical protein
VNATRGNQQRPGAKELPQRSHLGQRRLVSRLANQLPTWPLQAAIDQEALDTAGEGGFQMRANFGTAKLRRDAEQEGPCWGVRPTTFGLTMAARGATRNRPALRGAPFHGQPSTLRRICR